MFRSMGTYDIGMKKIYVGQQNFETNSVLVKVGNEIKFCPMGVDEDNDIYFEFLGDKIYFRWLK